MLAAIEEMNTASASSLAFRSGISSRIVANCPRQLTANMRSMNASSSASRSAWGDGFREARRVHENVYAAEVLFQFAAQRLERGRIGNVGFEGGVSAAFQFGLERRRFGGVAATSSVRDGDGRACRCEGRRRCRADAAIPAHDKDNPIHNATHGAPI